MTSFLIESIRLERGTRQRSEITQKSIDEMADSFTRLGQLQNIVLRRDGTLVIGETRYTAAKQLGWTHIEVTFTDEMDERILHSMELEENIKRTDLPWQDQVRAIKRYHELQKDLNETWTHEETAQALGLSENTVQQYIGIAKAVESGNERVINAPKLSTARGIVSRENERARSDEAALLPEMEDEVEKILNVDFRDWVKTYSGTPFNLIHCDFPYGIGADKFNQGAAASFGGYEDSRETYWSLVDALIENRQRLMGESAHIFFWFSMALYSETLTRLKEHFWVDPYPFIWYKDDNKGTLPWPDKSGRRVYEVAFLCSHGDRKIISPISNVGAYPRGEVDHMSEKSEPMLKNFFRMFIDKNTRLLDPTCGSGSALRAAESLGAGSVLGLEINSEFATNARRALRK